MGEQAEDCALKNTITSNFSELNETLRALRLCAKKMIL
jgi:hypothetical protein